MKFTSNSVSVVQMGLVGLAILSLVLSTLWFAQRQSVLRTYEKGAASVAVVSYPDPAVQQLEERVTLCVQKTAFAYVSGLSLMQATTQNTLEHGQQAYKDCYNQQIDWAQTATQLPRL